MDSQDGLQDESIFAHLDSKATLSKNIVIIETLGNLVQTLSCNDWIDQQARLRVENNLHLTTHFYAGTVLHNLPNITRRQHYIAFCSQSDLSCSYIVRDLTSSHGIMICAKDFKCFLAHAMKLSEAFRLASNGYLTQPKENKKKHRGGNNNADSDTVIAKNDKDGNIGNS